MTSDSLPTRYANASDAIAWKYCHRRAWFDLREPELALGPDPFDQLIMQAGIDHERAVLESLGPFERARDEQHTAELMAAMAPLIYQPKFRNDDLHVKAQPDFLFLEDAGYRAGDAKYSKSLEGKPDLGIQLAVYQLLLGTELPTVALLKNAQSEMIREKDLEEAKSFLSSMAELSSAARPEVHYVVSRCTKCPYRKVCVPEFRDSGNLGQSYFVDARAIPGLQSAGIGTLRDLAAADPNSLPDIPYFKGDKKRNAVLHAQALADQQIRIVSTPAGIPGTVIHFDIETNPLASESGDEAYLWGLLLPPYESDDFEYVWHDGGTENDRAAWQSFLRKVNQVRERFDDAVLVHYANFERTVIRRYATKYDQMDDPTVAWLLEGGGLFDLLKTVQSSLILPTLGYGLKEICKHEGLVNFQWELQESGSQWSVVRYHDFLTCTDQAERDKIKKEILSYNRDDVRATRALEQWLYGLAID